MYGSYRYRSSDMEGLGILLIIVVLVLVVATFIAWCKMFRKADRPWERLFVPIYGQYSMYSIAGCGWIFYVTIGVTVLFTLLQGGVMGQGRYTYQSAQTVQMLGIVQGIILLVLQIVYSVKLAKAFGKGGGFAVGLVLLYPIFIMILGYGDAEYELYVGGSYGGGKVGLDVPGWTCTCGTYNPASRGRCENCGRDKNYR